jgi:hypothetical protein
MVSKQVLLATVLLATVLLATCIVSYFHLHLANVLALIGWWEMEIQC